MDVDGEVVDGGAVHQDIIAAKHGRDHAGDRHGGAQRPPYGAFAMLDGARRVEIGAQAEERGAQVLDEHIAVLALEEPCHLAAARQRDPREGIVVHRIAVDEAAPVAQPHFLLAPAHRDARGDDSSDARAADEIDRHPRLAQRLHDAQVREAARTAAGQHETHTAPRDESCRAAEIRGVGDVVMLRDRQGLQPAARGAGNEAALMQQHELDRRAARGGGAHSRGPRQGRASGARERENQVRLPAALAQPAALRRSPRRR